MREADWRILICRLFYVLYITATVHKDILNIFCSVQNWLGF